MTNTEWIEPAAKDGMVNVTVDDCFYGIVSTACAIADTYGDPRFKAADVVAFLIATGDDAMKRMASPELQELFESDAFKKYREHLHENVLPGKRTEQVIESVHASKIQGIKE